MFLCASSSIVAGVLVLALIMSLMVIFALVAQSNCIKSAAVPAILAHTRLAVFLLSFQLYFSIIFASL